MHIPSLRSALVAVTCILAPAVAGAQGTWNVALTPTMNPLPVGFCAAIHLTIFDASGEVPRHRTGFRVTITDFDIAVTGASVIAHQIDASHWESCACQGGAPGTTATVTATYRAQPVAGPVQVPSFTKTATFVTAPPKGTINPFPCLTAGGAPASPPPASAAPPAAPPTTCAVPGTPPNLAVTTSGNVLNASWKPPTAIPPPTSYTLVVTGAFNGTLATQGLSISGAVGPGRYTMTVAATNACGSSAPSLPQTVTIP